MIFSTYAKTIVKMTIVASGFSIDQPNPERGALVSAAELTQRQVPQQLTSSHRIANGHSCRMLPAGDTDGPGTLTAHDSRQYAPDHEVQAAASCAPWLRQDAASKVPPRAAQRGARRRERRQSVSGARPLPAAVDAVLSAPTEMSVEERMLLYALVRGLKPERVLEIGTSLGGSSFVMAAAMEENGTGRIVSIDPSVNVDPEDSRFHGRFVQLQATSPAAVDEAARVAGGAFDLALIDGIHIYKQAAADLAATLHYLADDAYVLLHDSFHFGVSEAIREAVEAEARLIDCGYVCTSPRPVFELATHAGFRLLRWGAPVVDPTPLVQPLWNSLGLPVPHDRALLNHDFWYCAEIEPCDHCVRAAAALATTV